MRFSRIAGTALTVAALLGLGSAGSTVFAMSNVAIAAAAPASAVKTGGSAFSSIASPKANSNPAPNYNTPCWNGGTKGAANTSACRTQVLAAIQHQHAVEHVRAITVPSGFWSLSTARQIFVVTNLERTSRGLKPVTGISAQMSTWALKAAQSSTDPSIGAWDLANGTQLQTFGAIWASDLNVLDADFIWMYADGWGSAGSQNADCTTARSSGCWGHRQIILGQFGGTGALVAGVGSVANHDAHGLLNSDAEAIASYTGPKPVLVYTWAQAVAAGAR